VPFGYVSDALDLVDFVDASCGLTCDDDQLTTGFCFDPVIGGPDLAGGSGSGVCPFALGSPIRTWLTDNRALMATLAWAAVLIPLVAFVWRKSVPFINAGS
jgi:hypothetical protein